MREKQAGMGGMSKPPLGITMGCPAGIGPEIIVRAIAARSCSDDAPGCVVLGDRRILERACDVTGLGYMKERITPWQPGAPAERGNINLLEETRLACSDVPFGKESAVTGRAAYAYLIRAIELALDGSISGIVTAPLSKAGLRMAGINHPGHTEILAEATGTRNYAMMLAGSRLRVTLVTIHCALADVAAALSTPEVLRLIKITDRALRELFNIQAPRIAVAALNPHAGEGGMFGDEEKKIISPAVREAEDLGIEASGPLPPDTVFHAAWQGNFDAVVCMYHDQGLIPFKLVHFSDGVNVTLGLPVIRTSVDHGTAYDIAGTGKADPKSLCAAMSMASGFAANRSIAHKT